MNTEIKIRAWDNIAKKMYYGKQEQFDDMLGFRFQHFEVDAAPVYMQCTSLKDKRRKEIYKGDILRRDNNPKDILIVDFYEGVFGWWENIEWGLSNPIKEFTAISGWDSENRLQIISNIHENPELAKELRNKQ